MADFLLGVVTGVCALLFLAVGIRLFEDRRREREWQRAADKYFKEVR